MNSELYKFAGDSFHERLLVFFNIIYMMGEMPEEWKNSIVIPLYYKGDKQTVENYRGISLLNACYKLYSKILIKKLNARAEKYPLACQNGFRKGRARIDLLFSMELFIEKQRGGGVLIWKHI